MQNHSNENEFDLHENGSVGETHFHMNGFARRLVLKQRQRGPWKWLIGLSGSLQATRKYLTVLFSYQQVMFGSASGLL